MLELVSDFGERGRIEVTDFPLESGEITRGWRRIEKRMGSVGRMRGR